MATIPAKTISDENQARLELIHGATGTDLLDAFWAEWYVYSRNRMKAGETVSGYTELEL